MVPVPLTLVGILPGHWLFGAFFTATSMIGFIALAGIIVRNSILLVDFVEMEWRDRGHLPFCQTSETCRCGSASEVWRPVRPPRDRQA